MIHGLIVVNKEKGISSHAVVDRVRRLFGTKKAGHFGTLDPQATGVLLIALGQATRFFDFYVKQEKLYSGLIRFGYATSTYDSEGAPQGAKQAVDLFRHRPGSPAGPVPRRAAAAAADVLGQEIQGQAALQVCPPQPGGHHQPAVESASTS